ncbi:nuclear envelope pore membrane protein POM 121 isoform X2 [Hypomesus transpacificus]|uniref:nuclear envelope pore membrane protein POM 121 isoform X2 n=1 Tax=Hypomesus transpacificus TaxID=137520 RepID=UPI001F076BF6|nr:nuclear envelope pore membrane protein POM 121 isoform X2 [Hypomesus transpacificus]
MSPREKRFIALISLVFCAIAIFCLALYYIPTFLYITLILGTCCVACYYHAGESLYARLGPHPRRGLTIPPALRRWFPGRTANGVPTPERLRSRPIKGDIRGAVAFTGQRRLETTIFRRDTAQSDSLLFSPRDILMGSYIGKAESPPAVVGRPRADGSFEANPNAREQLRERLSRPNHAVYTPNRRLSFGEPLNNMGKFTITPQRHYPLQQTGTSSLGILPPAQWDGFRKKNILTPRNSSAIHSPVTVKIARPDHHSTRSPFYDHLNSPGVLGSPAPAAPADPCSRETVLSVLKESRKREVEEDDERSFVGGQKSKRRRNDSGGSAQSAFEPLLPNGAPSQMIPKPGNLKRGIAAATAEDSIMKRSRTSSISSVNCGQAPSGTLGSARNPIRSSYSSSQGVAQGKKTSTRSLSPLSSPGSSRSQTPERASKKPREDEICSPSSASSVRSDKTATDSAPVTGKLTPAPEAPPTASSSDSAGSGRRKRKIQLVSSRRGDHISLPPPPELGYTITVKDLDQEKRAALSQIQKVLEEPAPEPEKPSPAPAVSALAQLSSSTNTTPTLSSLLAAPLPTESAPAAPIPVINLDPAPVTTGSTTPATTAAPAPASNPLLESLKMMRGNAAASAASTAASTTASTTASASAVSVATSGMMPADSGGSALKRSSTMTTPLSVSTPVSLSQPTAFPIGQPAGTLASAFTQVLGQATKAPTTIPTLGGSALFSLTSPLASTASTTASTTTPAATTETAGSTNPLMASVFKPVFGAPPTTAAPPTSAPGSQPAAAAPTFKPLFGSATSSSAFGQSLSKTTMAAPSPAPQLFGGLSNSTAGLPAAEPAAQPPLAAKSLFGNWSAAPPTTAPSAVTPAPSAGGSGFQFGAAAAATAAPAPSSTATTSGGNSAFTFGTMTTASSATMQPAPPAQAKPQGGFTFGQAASSQGSAPGTFGGFGMGSVGATTASAAAAPPPATQSSFAFGKPSFDTASAAAFPSTTQAPGATGKPFAFGSSAARAPPASAPPPFAFGGGAASTVAPAFGGGASTTAASAFGGGASTTAASAFGGEAATTAASAFGGGATSTAASAFGGGAPTTAASTFGSSAKPAFGSGSTGFAFGSTTTPSAAAAPPAFGSATQTAGALLPPPASTFTFGGGLLQHNPATPAQPASGGFNFGAAISGSQFGSPIPNNPTTQTPGFNFGSAAAKDMPAFGTSTPAFGQSAAPGPIPFGTPGTPVQGFNTPSPFGSPSTPSFSIGAGSKPSGARQRLQARRQHPRKK